MKGLRLLLCFVAHGHVWFNACGVAYCPICHTKR